TDNLLRTAVDTSRREREASRPRRLTTTSLRWGGRAIPAGAQLRQGEVGGELTAAVPHRGAFGGDVAVHADRVAGHLTRAAGAVTQSDLHTGVFEPGEEVGLAGSGGGNPPHLPT